MNGPAVEGEIEKAKNNNIRIITLLDREYPVWLRHIDNAPPVLYLKGCLVEEDHFSLAMVGSQMMSDYGKKIASDLASALALSGLTIVSGMARHRYRVPPRRAEGRRQKHCSVRLRSRYLLSWRIKN